MEILKKYIYQVRGVSYKPSDVCDNEKGVPILRAGNICDNRICLDDIVCVDSSKIRPEQFLRDGDILICASSGSKSVVGKAAIYKLNNFISAFGAFCKVVRIKEDENVLADFIRLYFSSKFYREQISNKSQGANINNIKAEDIDSLLINIPDIQTQNIAVSELDKIQAALDNKKEQLKKLDELIQSKFYEMFGDPVVNDKGWDLKPFGELFDTILGKMLDKKKQIKTDVSLPYLGNVNVQWGYFILDNLKEMTFTTKEREKFKLNIGDLLICEGGESGRCAIWKGAPQEILFQKAIHRARPKKINEVNTQYVAMLLKELKSKGGLKTYVSQSTIEHLTGVKLGLVPIILPPLPLQQAFAAYVEKVEQAKAIVNQEIAHLQELLDSRMDFYFHTKTEM